MRKIIVVLVAILLFGCNSKEKAEYNYDLGITKFNSKEYSLAKEEFSKAIEYCNKILDLEPDNIGAMYNRAVGYYMMGNIHKALDGFRAIMVIEPENQEVIIAVKELNAKLN